MLAHGEYVFSFGVEGGEGLGGWPGFFRALFSVVFVLHGVWVSLGCVKRVGLTNIS